MNIKVFNGKGVPSGRQQAAQVSGHELHKRHRR